MASRLKVTGGRPPKIWVEALGISRRPSDVDRPTVGQVDGFTFKHRLDAAFVQLNSGQLRGHKVDVQLGPAPGLIKRCALDGKTGVDIGGQSDGCCEGQRRGVQVPDVPGDIHFPNHLEALNEIKPWVVSDILPQLRASLCKKRSG